MAIITVLAAIAIPTFGKQLETAREANDAEAIRAAVTDAFTEAHLEFTRTGDIADTTIYPSGAVAVSLKQTKAGWNYMQPTFDVGGGTVTASSTSVPAANSTAGKAIGTKYVQVFFELDGTEGIKLKDICLAPAANTAYAAANSIQEAEP